jgi:uncharacterized small protein (DUF1192 family)
LPAITTAFIVFGKLIRTSCFDCLGEQCTAANGAASLAISGTKSHRISTAAAALSRLDSGHHGATRRIDMDLDDLLPPKKPGGVTIGESLATLSVAELERRIKDLEGEIERVRLELDRKRKHEAAAHSLFKS